MIKKTLLNKRSASGLRTISVLYDCFGYADSSVLFGLGNTKVLCSITLQSGVPHFLRGQGEGWLNAEYALLPTATQQRVQREAVSGSRAGRSIEISRLIGRSFRSVIDRTAYGERTISIDCDVLQADGGTRVAAMMGASIALKRAQAMWLAKKILNKPFLQDDVAAISIGVANGQIMVDPDFAQDASLDADFNFIVTRSGALIEVHGGAEKGVISWDVFEKARAAALVCAQEFFQEHQTELILAAQESVQKSTDNADVYTHESSLFSLKNRLLFKQ